MNTLTYSATTLTLPLNMLWPDEFAWPQVQQARSYTITGALVVQSGAKLKGRAITLDGGDWTGITRADLLTLRSWAALPAQQFGLVVRSEASRTVLFDHEAGAIEAAPLWDVRNPASSDFYRIKLRFLEV